MPQTEVTKAVRTLRKRLGDTQQQFANRLGMAISTVVRYELTRPPRGSALTKFARLALQHEFKEEAGVFLKSLYKDMGLTSADWETSLEEGAASMSVLPGSAGEAGFVLPATGRDVEAFELDLSPYVFRGTQRGVDLVLDLLWAVKGSINPADSISLLEHQLNCCRLKRRQYEEGIEQALAQFFEISELDKKGLSTEEIAARLSLPTTNVELSLKVSREILRVLPEGESKVQLRRFFFALPVGGARDEYAGNCDRALATRFRLPISMVQIVRKEPSKLGIPAPHKHLPSRLGEDESCQGEEEL